MKGSINVRFRYTEEEYSRAVKKYYLSTLNIKMDIIISLIILVSGIYLYVSSRGWGIYLIMILLSNVFLLMILYIVFVSPHKVFRQQAKFHEEFRLAASDEEILFNTEHTNSKIEWNGSLKVKDNKEFYYLVYGKLMFTIIPKRVFSREQDMAFRELLNSKLKPR